MYNKFNTRIAVILVTVLANSFSAMAYPASDTDRLPTAKVCQEAIQAAAEIDIPAKRADYNVLDRAAGCVVVAGVKTSIPVTGYVAAMIDRYEAMKDRQAELMDRSGYPSRRQIDQRFMEFKTRQAEQKTP